MVQKSVYAQDGVNISVGDALSREAAEICRSTYDISSFVEVKDFSQGNFRGPRGYRYINLPDGWWETGSADGSGTKPILFAAGGRMIDSPSGLIAMTAMDITRYGGLPLVLFNLLDVSSLGNSVESTSYKMFQEAFQGLKRLAHEHHFVVLDGEIAELSEAVGSEDPYSPAKFNWGGVMMGVYHDDKMILGNTLRPGQVIVVFADVFRDNGISSVRRALGMHYDGYHTWWYENPDALEDIRACATPSAQYDRMFNMAHGWFNPPNFEPLVKMHLLVHLSGGAFKTKLGEILAQQGLAARLPDLFQPPAIMQKCKKWRKMRDEESYTTWNGGQGALAVIDKEDVPRMCELAALYNNSVKVAGVIEDGAHADYTVAIKSQFESGKWIYYL